MNMVDERYSVEIYVNNTTVHLLGNQENQSNQIHGLPICSTPRNRKSERKGTTDSAFMIIQGSEAGGRPRQLGGEAPAPQLQAAFLYAELIQSQ